MKLIHLSDLHLGKRVNEFSMLEDQQYILKKILSILDQEQPDCVLIAGDVYDKSVPSAEAVQLFDDFLCRLAERSLQVLIISGNHDSAERLSFGGRLMTQSGIHISPVYSGEVSPVVLRDEYGPVNFYLLPFVKPVHIRRFFPQAEINTYSDAVAVAVEQMAVDVSQRNVLVTHQFVTGATRSDSEELSVGGSDNVDVRLLDNFDYVALGHIHGPQKMTRETVRYCGTPLKYSFSEAGHQKSVTVVEMGEKGRVSVRAVPLTPLRDLREIRGSYEELTLKANWEHTNREDYLRIILTDEEDIPDGMGKLRVIYKNLMKLDYDNRRTRSAEAAGIAGQVEEKSPLTLFGELYEKQNNQPMSPQQEDYIRQWIQRIWEGEQ